MAASPGARDVPLAALESYLKGLAEADLDRALRSLARDPRAGARALVRKFRRREEAVRSEELRMEGLFSFELSLRQQGYAVIAGVDEVGRGALAGPLVAGAAVLDAARPLTGLRDSKLLDGPRREALYDTIVTDAVAWAVVEMSPTEIDARGIQLANMMALRHAVEALAVRCDYVLTDGFTLAGMEVPSLGLVRGDKRSASVAAASVLAKVTRDRFMREIAACQYPGYGFEEHVGYSTAGHVEALRRLGPCPLHRRSFAPVATAAEEPLDLG